MTLTGTNDPITTTDMSIRFLAPCRTDCLAEATVIKFGRSLVPVEIKMKDEPGTLVAIAQVTYMRLESR
jgi:acyl-coenzyme A thioesterase PaaI-like protein